MQWQQILWIKRGDPYQFFCSYKDLEEGRVRVVPFPFQPEWIMEAMGLGDYGTPDKYVGIQKDGDYLVKLVVPDLKTLSRILNEVFLPHRSVGHVRSSVVLDRVKQTTQLPLRHLSELNDTKGARQRTSPMRTPWRAS